MRGSIDIPTAFSAGAAGSAGVRTLVPTQQDHLPARFQPPPRWQPQYKKFCARLFNLDYESALSRTTFRCGIEQQFWTDGWMSGNRARFGTASAELEWKIK